MPVFELFIFQKCRQKLTKYLNFLGTVANLASDLETIILLDISSTLRPQYS